MIIEIDTQTAPIYLVHILVLCILLSVGLKQLSSNQSMVQSSHEIIIKFYAFRKIELQII